MQNTAKVPVSTYLMLVGLMVLFFAGALLIMFPGPVFWWAIPAVAALAVFIGGEQKSRQRRLRREQPDAVDDSLLD